MRSKICDNDCFNCKYDDCIKDTMTTEERAEANYRDEAYKSYGHICSARANLSKTRKLRDFRKSGL